MMARLIIICNFIDSFTFLYLFSDQDLEVSNISNRENGFLKNLIEEHASEYGVKIGENLKLYINLKIFSVIC